MRALRDAGGDILAIARASGGLNEAHVGIDPDDGEPSITTGFLSALVSEDRHIHVSSGSDLVFVLDPESFRGAWLHTFDGADYYSLRLDLGWGRVTLSDAYNGL